MNKKIATLLISSLLMVPVQAFADTGVETSAYEVQVNNENNSTKEVKEGVTPDSFLYTLDKLAENIKVTITFDSVKKAKLFLAMAEERLDESNSMIIKSKNELAEKALKEYKTTLDNAINTTNQAMEDGKKVSNITKEIEDTTLSQREIIEKILSKLKDEIKDTVQEELEKTYEKAEATKDVVILVEDKDKENDEDEEEKSPENVVVEVIINEKIKDEAIIEKARAGKLNSRQMIAIISLAQQSGKSLEEVMDVFKNNDKGLGSTAIALGIAPKDALKGINNAFKEYKSQVKNIIKSNGGNISLEQLQEINKEIVGETKTDNQKTSNQDLNNQSKGTVIIQKAGNTSKDTSTDTKITDLKGKANKAIEQVKNGQANDKVIKEIEKAEKKTDKIIQKAEEKAKKFEAKNKSKEIKVNDKGNSKNNK